MSRLSMKMSKVTILIAMLALSLSACGGDGHSESDIRGRWYGRRHGHHRHDRYDRWGHCYNGYDRHDRWWPRHRHYGHDQHDRWRGHGHNKHKRRHYARHLGAATSYLLGCQYQLLERFDRTRRSANAEDGGRL